MVKGILTNRFYDPFLRFKAEKDWLEVFSATIVIILVYIINQFDEHLVKNDPEI